MIKLILYLQHKIMKIRIYVNISLVIIFTIFNFTITLADTFVTNLMVKEIVDTFFKGQVNSPIYIENLTNLSVNSNKNSFKVDSIKNNQIQENDFIFCLANKYDIDFNENSLKTKNLQDLQIIELINLLDSNRLINKDSKIIRTKDSLTNKNTKKEKPNKKVIRVLDNYNKEFFLDIDNIISLNDSLSKVLVGFTDSTNLSKYTSFADLRNKRLNLLKREIQKTIKDKNLNTKKYLLLNQSLIYFFKSNNLKYKNYDLKLTQSPEGDYNALNNLKIFIENNGIENVIYNNEDTELAKLLDNFLTTNKVNFINIDYNSILNSNSNSKANSTTNSVKNPSNFDYIKFMKELVKRI